MARRKKEVVAEPILEQEKVQNSEEKSEIIELEESEELKGTFNNLEPMRKVEYKRTLRKLD